MAELTVDLVYSNALYSVAEDIGKKNEILEEGLEILKIIDKEKKLVMFLRDPAIAGEDKKAVVKQVFADRISREMLNFIFVLIDNRRTRNFHSIMREFKRTADRDNGVTRGEIHSVRLLTNSQISRFEKEISRLLGKKVSLDNKIEEGMIGGIKIMVDGRMIDASLKKRLDDIAAVFEI